MSFLGSNSSSQDLLMWIAKKPDAVLTKADGTIYIGYCLPNTAGTGDSQWSIAKVITTIDGGGDETVLMLWASGDPNLFKHVFDNYATYTYKFPIK